MEAPTTRSVVSGYCQMATMQAMAAAITMGTIVISKETFMVCSKMRSNQSLEHTRPTDAMMMIEMKDSAATVSKMSQMSWSAEITLHLRHGTNCLRGDGLWS